MTTMNMPARILPGIEEFRAMLTRPSVAIAAITGITLVMLAAVGGVVYLAATGRGTEAVGGLLLGVLALVLNKLERLKSQAKEIAAQNNEIKAATNGTNTRLLDTVLGQASAPAEQDSGPQTR